jgi:hypothetical protein
MGPGLLLLVLFEVLVGLASVSGLEGQQQTDPPFVAARLSRSGNYHAAVRILTQPPPLAYPSDQLRVIADTLVAIAVSASERADAATRDSASIYLRTASGIVEAFRMAANGELGAPYAGAVESLIRVAQAGAPVSAEAVYHIALLPNKAQNLDRLRLIAMGNSKYGALAAVEMLMRTDRAGPEGPSVLCDLYRQQLIIERVAKDAAGASVAGGLCNRESRQTS